MSDETLVSAAEVARLAGVGRAAVSNWRRRHPDFPEPVAASSATPAFRRAAVEQWLRREGKLADSAPADMLWRALDADRGRADMVELVTDVATYLADGAAGSRCGRRTQELMDQIADESAEQVLDQVIARLFERQQRQHLATPAELAALMADLAGPIHGTVFDPACGAGNLLRVAAARGAEVVAGQEIDGALVRLASARFRLSRDASSAQVIAEGDSLRADAMPDLRADVVLCDPPFGYRHWGHDELGVDPRWEYGFPVKGEPELAWLQHCLFHTREGGTVVMVMPAGVASRRSGRSIRQSLLRRGAIRAVIALPAGVLMSTGIPIHLWVLRNPERAGADPVLLVDAGELRPQRRGKVDWPRLRGLIDEPWRQFTGTGTVDEVPGRQRAIEAIDLLDEDVDLTPGRHLPLPAAAVDPAALEADRADVAQQIRHLAKLLPRIEEHDRRGVRPATTLNDLARAGAVVLRQHLGRLDTSDDQDAIGPLVLTGRDLAGGRMPATRLVTDPTVDVIALLPGDVVTPSVFAGGGQPAAVVIEESNLVLGPNVQLIRPDQRRIDPHFLAGQLRTSRARRASSPTASGVHRLDVRRVEIPVLDIDEQRRLGEKFRLLRELEIGLREAADRGVRLARTVTDGLAEGDLDFHLVTKRSQRETR